MESIKPLLDLVNQYGLPLVLLLTLIGWIRPKLDRIFDLAMRIESKDKDKLRAYQDKMRYIMGLNEQVMDIIRAMLAEFDASRVFVMSYHNGGHSVAGLDFAKASCTHEAVSLGVKPRQLHLQNLPVTMFCTFNRHVLNHGGVRCGDIDCFRIPDPAMFESLASQGVKSIYCVGLYSNGGLPLGFLGMEYSEEHRELTDAEFSDLNGMAARVATLLCVADAPMCRLPEDLSGAGEPR